jgi:hypothetical protein
VVAVERLAGDARGAAVNRVLNQVDVDETLPLDRTRRAALIRREMEGSAVDALVGEAATRTRAAFVITPDPDDMRALIEREVLGVAHVVTV